MSTPIKTGTGGGGGLAVEEQCQSNSYLPMQRSSPVG